MASRDHAAKFVAQRQAPHSMKAPEERRAEIIRQFNFYNQRYCGCEFSMPAEIAEQ